MPAYEKVLAAQRLRRKRRVRSRILGTAERPRLSVFRSGKHIYCQLIDDAARRTIAAASSRDRDLRDSLKSKADREAAAKIGTALAQKALQAGITKVRFDRGPYKYHGRLAALADAVRQAGVEC
jgi:large subunit ribosomal protein L18